MESGNLTRILLCACILLAALPSARADASVHFIDEQVAAHPGQSGSYVLDTGAASLDPLRSITTARVAGEREERTTSA